MDAHAPDAHAADDEVWTVGEAADYLNAGGVNFGITPKRVRRMAKNPSCQIRAVAGGTEGGQRTWFRLLASTVRAERARLLTLADRQDPGYPTPGEAG